MEPVLRIEGREYSKTSHGVFEVPLHELSGLRFADVPFFSTVEISHLPGNPETYLLQISATHAGGPQNEEFFLSTHANFFVDIDPSGRFKVSGLADRKIHRIQKAFAPLVESHTVNAPSENRIQFDAKRWYCGLLYSKYFERIQNPVLFEALCPIVEAFTPLVRSPDLLLFICHASEDKPFVDELAKFLDKKGTQIWYDQREIKVGQSIVERINEGLDQATHLLVICSKVSVTKPWVRKELSVALMRQLQNRSIQVIPVVTDDCILPSLLADIRYANCRQNHEAGFKELIEGILA